MDETEILRTYRRIAVVGLTSDESRPSNSVSAYMRAAGYEIVPVNPNEDEVFGLRSYPRLQDVPGPIDIVNIFRRPIAVPAVVDDAIAVGAKVIWMQSGIRNEEGARKAREAGLAVVMDSCIRTVHQVARARGLL